MINFISALSADSASSSTSLANRFQCQSPRNGFISVLSVHNWRVRANAGYKNKISIKFLTTHQWLVPSSAHRCYWSCLFSMALRLPYRRHRETVFIAHKSITIIINYNHFVCFLFHFVCDGVFPVFSLRIKFAPSDLHCATSCHAKWKLEIF